MTDRQINRRVFGLASLLAGGCLWTSLHCAEEVRGDDALFGGSAGSIQVPILSPRTIIRHRPHPKTGDAPVVSTVSLHPRQSVVATGGDDHVVRVWDLASGQLLLELRGHDDWVRSVRFSPDGQRLATAAADGRILLWDHQSGRHLTPFAQAGHPISAMQFTPDGNSIVIAGFRCEVMRYSLATGLVDRRFPTACGDMRSLDVSPDGRWLVGGGRNGHVRLWSLADGRVAHDIPAHRQRIRTVMFADDSRHIITAGEDRAIHKFDVATGELVQRIPHPQAKILACVMIDDAFVAAAGSDNIIRIYDQNSGSLTAELHGHSGSVATMDCTGAMLASGSFDTTVCIWDISRVSPELHRASISDDATGVR